MRTRLASLTFALCLILSLSLAEESPRPRASEFIQYVSAQLGNGYIWGASGQTCSKNFRYGRAQVHPDSAALIFLWGDAWDGLPVFDCIGLFKAFVKAKGANVSTEVNAALAWKLWTVDFGPLKDAVLTPGMALFRVEGPRMSVEHIGVYIGNGKAIHARGTRWGVVEDALPNIFTHWAKLNWLEYDLPPEAAPAVTGVFLDIGSQAVIDSDDGQPVTISPIPHEAGKLRQSIGFFADGARLIVLDVPDEISRLVEGIDTKGRTLTGYVRLTELREAPER